MITRHPDRSVTCCGREVEPWHRHLQDAKATQQVYQCPECGDFLLDSYPLAFLGESRLWLKHVAPGNTVVTRSGRHRFVERRARR